MVEHQNFPSIEQFRNVIRNVKARASYDGKDEDGNVKWKPAIAPKLKYVGTVKMHGTNSAIGITGASGEVWFQSRNNVITPDSDNAGFARYMTDTVGIDTLKANFTEFYTKNALSPNVPVVIYGEWCGSSIQKGVALCQLPKMFVVFAVRYGTEDDTVWLLPDAVKQIEMASKNIFNIFNFTTYELEIDFENPHVAQEKLIELTIAVEKECPVGKAFLQNIYNDQTFYLVDNDFHCTIDHTMIDSHIKTEILKVLHDLKNAGINNPSITLSLD